VRKVKNEVAAEKATIAKMKADNIVLQNQIATSQGSDFIEKKSGMNWVLPGRASP